MTDRTRILGRIKAIQVLAERGVDGEKESAAAMLEHLMKKYGISESELEEERRELAWFRFKTQLDRKLLNQVIYCITGRIAYRGVGGNTGKPRKVVGIECTAAERLEIEISFDFYNNALKKELDRFYKAFISKNNIFPEHAIDQIPDTGEIDIEETVRISAMMKGMEKHTRQKELESGTGK